MGAKLFAWLGGLAAFLGAAFFLKYSFDHGWIPAELRVAMGYVFAIGLLIGGLRLAHTRYAITAQTLIATGVVCLYAVTFACNSIYHFALFGPAGLPAEIRTRLHEAAVAAVTAPDARERLAAAGAEISGAGGDELASLMRGDIAKWGRVVKTGNIKAD